MKNRQSGPKSPPRCFVRRLGGRFGERCVNPGPICPDHGGEWRFFDIVEDHAPGYLDFLDEMAGQRECIPGTDRPYRGVADGALFRLNLKDDRRQVIGFVLMRRHGAIAHFVDDLPEERGQPAMLPAPSGSVRPAAPAAPAHPWPVADQRGPRPIIMTARALGLDGHLVSPRRPWR